MSLAVFLRNCSHSLEQTGADATSATRIRYALQADSVTIQIAKTPIQLAVPKYVALIDFNTSKPTITVSGIVDATGQGSASVAGFENMEALNITRRYWDGSGEVAADYVDRTQIYYVPYKNALEEAVFKFNGKESQDSEIELEIGDASFPRYNRAAEPHTFGSAQASGDSTISGSFNETGGAVYSVAIQNARFDMDANSSGERWVYQIQFLAKYRKDILTSEL